jgi:hypothetical protein
MRVTSGAELASILGQADCGCEIVLANGVYTGDFSFQRSCPADRPVIIRAETMLAAAIYSPLRLEGEHVTVSGLHFQGPDAALIVGGAENRVLRNRFTGWRNVALRPVAGHSVEIGYNEFFEPAPWSPSDEICPTQLRMGIYSSELICSSKMNSGFHQDAHVHHNYFHDFPPKPNPKSYSSGQSDAIEICGGDLDMSDRRSGWLIEYNLIERHRGGYGVIDIKCGGTTVQYNTILASPGARIDIRSGSYDVLAGNWIEGAGGSVIHGGHHRVLGNRMTRLVLTAGNVPWNYAGPIRLADRTSVHQAAYGVFLAGNISDLLQIGWKRGSKYSYPVEETVIEQHIGAIQYDSQNNTTERPLASAPIPIAIRLDAASVGPYAGYARP